jgi:hypothetical protein
MVFALVIVSLVVSLIVGAWLVVLLSNRPGEAIRSVQRREFLGPGGPDDPFADEYHDAWLRRRQDREHRRIDQPAVDGRVSAARSTSRPAGSSARVR